MLDPIMDIDVGQIKDPRLVVPTENAGDLIRDIPTKGWSKVVVVADDLVQLLKRDFAAVAWQDACKNVKRGVSSESRSSVDQRDGAPEWTLP